ncbi:MAG TPA: hypothetical protein VGF67_26765 [Ktedonobacteraceae bacterium]
MLILVASSARATFGRAGFVSLFVIAALVCTPIATAALWLLRASFHMSMALAQ